MGLDDVVDQSDLLLPVGVRGDIILASLPHG